MYNSNYLRLSGLTLQASSLCQVEVMGSNNGKKHIKNGSHCCYVRYTTKIVIVKKFNSLQSTIKTSKQRSYNQIMHFISKIWFISILDITSRPLDVI